MKKISFASIGDLCIDNYERYNKLFPGGTAFNSAVYATKAGASAGIFSAMGTDISAQIFQKAFVQYNIDCSQVKILRGETSSIRIDSDDDGQRFFSDWKLGVLEKYILNSVDKKYLSEYDIAKIVLFKPLQKLFDQFCQTDLPSTLKVADFAGSTAYSDDTLVIRNYIDQLDVIVKSTDETDQDSISFLQKMSFDYKEKIILALLGKEGSMAFLNGNLYKQPAIETTVKDTTGAGDAYIAYFLLSYLKKRDIQYAMLQGSKAASEKISKIG